jgi:hypothetical protein
VCRPKNGAAPTLNEDAVETDLQAASSAEELDEDRLRFDPPEAGVDPPERWSGVDKYGMTPYEQAHPRGLTDRLSEGEPEVHDVAAARTRRPSVRSALRRRRGCGRCLRRCVTRACGSA